MQNGMQDVRWRRRLSGGVPRVGVQAGLREGAQAGAVQAGPPPAVPYCSWPAEEDLVLPTRCNSEPNEEQDLNKRKGGEGRRN